MQHAYNKERLLLTIMSRLASVYRQESGFTRDEQDIAVSAARLRIRVGQTERGLEVSQHVLRGADGTGCEDLEAGAQDVVRY